MPTFATPAPISVTVDLVAGDIRVIGSERTDAVVDVRPRTDSNDRDVKAAAQARVDFTDGKLTVKVPKPLQIYFAGRVGTVDVTIQVPSGSDVRGTTMHGDLRAEGRLGACWLKTYHGDISLHEAASLRLSTTHGQVTADRVAGDAHVTGSGDIQLAEVSGTANVKNLNGPSWIGQVGGDLHVNSAHGDISIDRAGSAVVARTAYGSVRIHDVARGSVVLQTASGEVEVGIRAGTAAWLDVKSSLGNVHNSLEATAQPEQPAETVQVRARTLDGDIIIRRATK